MRKQLISQYISFNKYAVSVGEATLAFLQMSDLPEISPKTDLTVSKYLGKPELTMTSRDPNDYEHDVSAIREWLNHIGGEFDEDARRKKWTFNEEEFRITIWLWKPFDVE